MYPANEGGRSDEEEVASNNAFRSQYAGSTEAFESCITGVSSGYQPFLLQRMPWDQQQQQAEGHVYGASSVKLFSTDHTSLFPDNICSTFPSSNVHVPASSYYGELLRSNLIGGDMLAENEHSQRLEREKFLAALSSSRSPPLHTQQVNPVGSQYEVAASAGMMGGGHLQESPQPQSASVLHNVDCSIVGRAAAGTTRLVDDQGYQFQQHQQQQQQQRVLQAQAETCTPRPRWCPTQEQIQILESLFNSGTTTPTRDMIVDIASQLRKYGNLAEANVFYWFQNRKARAKRKLQLTSSKIIDDTTTAASPDIKRSSLEPTPSPSISSDMADSEHHATKSRKVGNSSTVWAPQAQKAASSLVNQSVFPRPWPAALTSFLSHPTSPGAPNAVAVTDSFMQQQQRQGGNQQALHPMLFWHQYFRDGSHNLGDQRGVDDQYANFQTQPMNEAHAATALSQQQLQTQSEARVQLSLGPPADNHLPPLQSSSKGIVLAGTPHATATSLLSAQTLPPPLPLSRTDVEADRAERLAVGSGSRQEGDEQPQCWEKLDMSGRRGWDKGHSQL